MRLSIIPADGSVYKDNCAYHGLDLSFVPENIHALQWYDSYGEIEFKRNFVDGQIVHPQNQVIAMLPDWANQAIVEWEKANSEAVRIATESTTQNENIN